MTRKRLGTAHGNGNGNGSTQLLWEVVRFLITVGGLVVVFVQTGRWWGSTDAQLAEATRSITHIEELVKETAKDMAGVREKESAQSVELEELRDRVRRLEGQPYESHRRTSQ